MKRIAPLLLTLTLTFVASSVPGQEGEGGGAAQAAARPAPRWPDGRISFSGTPQDFGNWEGPANATLFFNYEKGKKVTPQANLAGNLDVNTVPLKKEMKELYLKREDQSEDPHTRCKPSGGSRFWHTPYGIEIVDRPEQKEILFLGVGAPHSWRIVYLDGREHPKDLKPSWYGHSIGKWEGDTLVVDTVGYNEKFWLTREGVPHTKQLHLIEKFSRPTYNQLRYEATIDDPGAYTATWSGGWNLRWASGNEPFDYLCQENNRDPARMIGGQ